MLPPPGRDGSEIAHSLCKAVTQPLHRAPNRAQFNRRPGRLIARRPTSTITFVYDEPVPISVGDRDAASVEQQFHVAGLGLVVARRTGRSHGPRPTSARTDRRSPSAALPHPPSAPPGPWSDRNTSAHATAASAHRRTRQARDQDRVPGAICAPSTGPQRFSTDGAPQLAARRNRRPSR